MSRLTCIVAGLVLSAAIVFLLSDQANDFETPSLSDARAHAVAAHKARERCKRASACAAGERL